MTIRSAGGGGGTTAAKISYDNATSGLTAVSAKAAIDELVTDAALTQTSIDNLQEQIDFNYALAAAGI